MTQVLPARDVSCSCALPFPAQKALKYGHPGVSKGVGLDSRHRCPCSDSVHGQCHWHHWFFGENTVNLDATKSYNITKLFGKGTDRSFASTQPEIFLAALSTTSPPTSPSGSAAETSLQIKGFYAMMARWKAAQGCLPLPIPRSSSIPTQSPPRHTDLTNYPASTPFPPLPPCITEWGPWASSSSPWGTGSWRGSREGHE